MLAGCILFVFIVMNLFCQPATNNQIGTSTNTVKGTKATKLDKAKVPKEVTDIYFKEYPMPTFETWYGYPSFDEGANWYEYDSTLYIDSLPENYVVEFTQNNVPYVVIYSKSGKKIAAHNMAISDIPKAISSAISNGEYKTWTLGKEKEEIFKDTDKDQMRVYKVNVEYGKEKHILYYQSDGQLLKDKKVF